MKRFTLLLCMLILGLTTNLQAQKKSKKEAVTKTSGKKSKKNQGWDAGLLGGVTYYNGELHCPDRGISNLRPGGGVYARYALSDNFFTRVNFQFGQIEGQDASFEEDWRRSRNFSFTSVIYDGALLVEWEPFGKYRYRGVKKFNRMLSPYLHLGVAGVYSKPVTNYNEPNSIARQADINTDKANKQNIHFAIPLGGGVRYDLNKSWMLGIEGGFRAVFTDYLDGVSTAGNPLKHDWYETLNLNIGYRFPFKRDKDGDGIPDDMDTCPDEPGTSRTKGCPDSDGDGVSNKKDNCPDEPGTAKTFGCPDSDGDNIVDKEDDCPNDKGSEFNKGCPDRDEDGIADKNDNCPDEKGTADDNGCPVIDSDKDGIADKEDKCPEMAGIAANLGCPDSSAITLDSMSLKGGTDAALTNTGTETLETPTIGTNSNATNSNAAVAPVGSIPSKKGTKTAKGAATTENNVGEKSPSGAAMADLPVSEVVILDEDGKPVSNAKTKKGKSSKKGTKKNAAAKTATSKENVTSEGGETAIAATSETTAKGVKGDFASKKIAPEDQQVLDEAMNGVFFDTNKATLKASSFSTLGKVALIIKRYPDYALRITGHTDDAGDDLDNVKLSVARARAIYNYFKRKGIDIQSILYRGCGSGNPAEDNGTDEGRAKNRRVEFDMVSK